MAGACNRSTLTMVKRGDAIISTKEALSKGKTKRKGSGPFFLNVVLMLKSEQWNRELCVYALSTCSFVVKGDVVFGIDEALVKGKTGWIECRHMSLLL